MVGWFFQTAACLLGPSPRQREEADDAHWLGIDGRVLTLVLVPFIWLSAAYDDVDDGSGGDDDGDDEKRRAALRPIPSRHTYPSSSITHRGPPATASRSEGPEARLSWSRDEALKKLQPR